MQSASSEKSAEAPYSVPFEGKVLQGLLAMRALTPSAMARYAQRNTEFYRRFYAGSDTRDFDSLPVLEKEMLRDVSPYHLLSGRLRDSVIYYGETTGSTGSPTPAFYTKREFGGATALSRITPYQGLIRRVLGGNRTCVNGITFGFTIAGASFGELLVNNGALVANVGSRSTIATPERTARAIARLRPSIVAAAPLDFLCWMRIVREDCPRDYDGVVESLKILLSTAELCSPSRVRAIEREFGLVHINTYASVEGFFSLPCPCREHHVLDIYRAEIFDHDLRKLPGMGRGRFAFTNLVKKSTPMVRYLLDDTVTLSRSSCPYGFTSSIRPHGRYELSIRIGGREYNVDDFEDAIFRHGLFGDYVVKVRADALDVTLEEYAAPDDASRAVQEELGLLTGLPARVAVVPFGELCHHREVRRSKPILKLFDARPSSTQRVPEYL